MNRRTYTIFVVDCNDDTLGKFRNLLEGFSHFVYCCSSIEQARIIMEGVAPDFVICNLEAPEGSAEEFLFYVQGKFPYSIRMIFGHEDEKNELIKIVASGLAHRHLCLPWEENNIPKVLRRDLKTRSRLKRNKCWKFLEAGGNLPVLPGVVLELENVLRNPEYSLSALVDVIEKDPAICSKILQVVNSAAFVHDKAIGSVKHAVTYLGSAQIREIVYFIAITKAIKLTEYCRPSVEEVGEHSFLCSRLSGVVAQNVIPDQVREAGTAALLHDIGKLLFFAAACGLYKDFLDSRDNIDVSATEFETELFGISHAEIGSSLMLWWNLPMTIVETAANHNLPLSELWGVPLSVSIADRCLMEASAKGSLKTDLDTLEDKYPIDKWRNLAIEFIEEINKKNV